MKRAVIVKRTKTRRGRGGRKAKYSILAVETWSGGEGAKVERKEKTSQRQKMY